MHTFNVQSLHRARDITFIGVGTFIVTTPINLTTQFSDALVLDFHPISPTHHLLCNTRAVAATS